MLGNIITILATIFGISSTSATSSVKPASTIEGMLFINVSTIAVIISGTFSTNCGIAFIIPVASDTTICNPTSMIWGRFCNIQSISVKTISVAACIICGIFTSRTDASTVKIYIPAFKITGKSVCIAPISYIMP